MILGIITAVIILLWIIPVAIKAKINMPIIIRMIVGLLLGAVPVVVAAMILNTAVEVRLLPALQLSAVVGVVVQAFCTGLIEEGLKLIAALLCTIKMKSERIVDYVLVFGAVGAGFEIVESVASVDNIFTLVLRTVMALHVVWLFYEGRKFFEAKNGKGMAVIIGYFTVAILHGIFDIGPLLMSLEATSDDAMVFGLIFNVIGTLINAFFIFKTMKKIKSEMPVEVK